MSLVDPDRMALLKRLFPVLGKHLRKGDCGKIGVIGGSPEYTGAPYFASITPMKIGADLTFVYAHPDAAGVIKSYSPEMIVYPSTDFATNRHSIDRLDALVFGPGLALFGNRCGRTFLHQRLFGAVQRMQKQCDHHAQPQRLFTQMYPNQKEIDSEDLAIQRKLTDQLASSLNVTVMRKGENDIISNGSDVQSRVGRAETSSRRCGGQGDILGGATALFAFWAKKASGSDVYLTEHLLDGAEAASFLVRSASLLAFQAVGRPMNAADVVEHINPVVRHIDNTDDFTS
uniref:ATP-dependent (S)-NAD(P)H-hydrate dehydratase n=1 Tax=Globodera pallida TaxID=36090 RepID=A0A183C9H3_GLOPA